MLAGRTAKHVDAGEQARFVSLTPDQQSLEIWLNTREIDEVVADMLERLATIEPRVARHDRYAYAGAVLVGLIVVGTPFLLYVLEHVRWE